MELDVYKDWLGIPDGPRPPDHYQLLRLVQFEDSVEKVRGNYKKLNTHVRKYATGKYSLQSQDLLNELAKAMLCLTDVERKKEYDKSLGRKVDDEFGAYGNKTMEVLLLERQLLTPAQVEQAREYSTKSGLEMRDTLIQLKLVEPAIAAQALAEELGLPFLDLAEVIPDDSVLDRVPKGLVKQHSILPLFIDNDMLLVACTNMPGTELEEELRLRFSLPMRAVLATPLAINQGIAKYYAPGARQEVEETSKSGSKSKKSGGASSSKGPRKRAELTPEEIQSRKQLGLLAMCWSVILCAALDQYLLPKSMLFLNWGFLVFWVPPIVIALVWKVYWRK